MAKTKKKKTTDFVEREKTAREIVRTQASIRKKHRALKAGRIASDIALERQYQSLVVPLKRIAQITESEKKESPLAGVKSETALQSTLLLGKKRKHEKSVDVEGNENYGDDDAIPVKRKRVSVRKRLPRLRAFSEASFLASTPKGRTNATGDVGRRRLRTEENDDGDDDDDDDDGDDDDGVFQPASEITNVNEALSASHDREAYLRQLGTLGRRYMDALLGGDANIDYVYGVYFTGPSSIMLGDKLLSVNTDDSILLDGVRYVSTPGLYELIFANKPSVYTVDDLKSYHRILLATNAHRKGHTGQVLGNKGYKYKHIIGPLLRGEIPLTSPSPRPVTSKLIPKKTGGAGIVPRAMRVNDDKIDYVHWDDPNELVERLRLLVESSRAGNNAHENEILSIIDELREAGLIV